MWPERFISGFGQFDPNLTPARPKKVSDHWNFDTDFFKSSSKMLLIAILKSGKYLKRKMSINEDN